MRKPGASQTGASGVGKPGASGVGKSGASRSQVSRSGVAKSGVAKSGAQRPRPTPPAEQSRAPQVPPEQASDSDIKLAPTDSAEVPLGKQQPLGPGDSEVRVERAEGTRPRATADSQVTEEIDLDAEERKAAQAALKGRPQAKQPALPTSSPFELSENDLNLVPTGGDPDSSSDFDLQIESAPLNLANDEGSVLGDDEEVSLGEISGGVDRSGINLKSPRDSGISLEQGGSDELEFELSLDSGATPKPAAKEDLDSSSEFELSLQDEAVSPAADEGSSEFELSLDTEGGEYVEKVEADPSEFELTLDEEAQGDEASALEEGEQDIFEPEDFDVPSLDEESGSEAVALDEADTDLESGSADFDLDVDEAPSGSQVVSLDEEEADDVAATVTRPVRSPRAGRQVEEEAADEEPMEDLGATADEETEGETEGEEEEEPALTATAPQRPAEWGPVPALLLIPCVLVMFVVGLMGFELIQGMWGYHAHSKVSTLVIDPIARMFDSDKVLPPE